MKHRILLTATLAAALALQISPAVLSETAPDAVGVLSDDPPPVKPSPSLWDETGATAPKSDAPVVPAATTALAAEPAVKAVSAPGCAKPELVVIDFDKWKASCELSKGLSRIHELRIDMTDKSVDSDVTNANYDQSGLSISYALSLRKTAPSNEIGRASCRERV